MTAAALTRWVAAFNAGAREWRRPVGPVVALIAASTISQGQGRPSPVEREPTRRKSPVSVDLSQGKASPASSPARRIASGPDQRCRRTRLQQGTTDRARPPNKATRGQDPGTMRGGAPGRRSDPAERVTRADVRLPPAAPAGRSALLSPAAPRNAQTHAGTVTRDPASDRLVEPPAADGPLPIPVDLGHVHARTPGAARSGRTSSVLPPFDAELDRTDEAFELYSPRWWS